jgi:ribosomal protein S6
MITKNKSGTYYTWRFQVNEKIKALLAEEAKKREMKVTKFMLFLTKRIIKKANEQQNN